MWWDMTLAVLLLCVLRGSSYRVVPSWFYPGCSEGDLRSGPWPTCQIFLWWDFQAGAPTRGHARKAPALCQSWIRNSSRLCVMPARRQPPKPGSSRWCGCTCLGGAGLAEVKGWPEQDDDQLERTWPCSALCPFHLCNEVSNAPQLKH